MLAGHTSVEQRRIRLLAGVVALLGIVCAVRLFYIQIVQGTYFAEAAEGQFKASAGYVPYDRGSIYFTSKSGQSLSAASLSSGYLLALNPKLVSNPEEVANILAPITGLPETEILAKASKSDDPYEELVHHISNEAASSIKALKLGGVLLVREQWRFYPAGDLAAQVLGFVGYDGDDYNGRYGVERQYDASLTRKPVNPYSNFFSDVFLGLKEDVFDQGKARSADVVLTIEPGVQALLESKLNELMREWKARSAAGVIIDPKTGEIVAMAGVPSFDPNDYGKAADPSVYENPLVENVYELGSIMKPITIVAGLDSGKLKADTTYIDKGFIELNGKKISNYDGKARGLTSMQDVLNQSLNVGAAYAESLMGKDIYRTYLQRFGFFDKTDVDLPNEATNLMDNLNSGHQVDFATAAFGQGIAVEPLSMVRALAALGNGGHIVKPHVTKSIDYTLGLSEEIKPIEQGRAISRESSDEITRMLVKVVDEHLAAGKLKMEHYSIAAKTGTAQIANPNGGGYYDDRYLHSFFGYFPAYKPRFLVFLMMREPQNVEYASETLTMPFRDIARFLISYYDIPPDR